MRLIDADALIAAHKEVCSRSMKFNLDLAPTVDAVPVVRCKDCKYCHIEDEYEAWCHGGLPAVLTRATEDFCSHGQRREEAGET